eukprot:326504_1
MQSTPYRMDDTVPSECDHSNCHYPYFNDEYKAKLRFEFRQLTVQKRQMLFETTTQRILLYLDTKTNLDNLNQTTKISIDYPFSIHCFLPYNGALVSFCKQFYCHTLKISYDMLELHHQTIWKTS